MTALLKVFDILPGWIWALICAGALAFAGIEHMRGNDARSALAEARAEFAEAKAKAAEDARKAEQAARETERAWQATESQTRSEKDAQIQTLTAERDAVVERLRQRPARPAAPAGGATATAQASPSGTGAGLYREDGIFLIGEAAAAARIAKERDYCYANQTP